MVPVWRHSLAFVAWPRAFIEPGDWVCIDYQRWVDDFVWDSDPPGLWRDRVSTPADTWAAAAGDCDDFACVALNWCWHATDRPIRLAVTLDGWRPTHVLVFDGERTHDSRFGVREWSLAEYRRVVDEGRLWTRRVRGNA